MSNKPRSARPPAPAPAPMSVARKPRRTPPARAAEPPTPRPVPTPPAGAATKKPRRTPPARAADPDTPSPAPRSEPKPAADGLLVAVPAQWPNGSRVSTMPDRNGVPVELGRVVRTGDHWQAFVRTASGYTDGGTFTSGVEAGNSLTKYWPTSEVASSPETSAGKTKRAKRRAAPTRKPKAPPASK